MDVDTSSPIEMLPLSPVKEMESPLSDDECDISDLATPKPQSHNWRDPTRDTSTTHHLLSSRNPLDKDKTLVSLDSSSANLSSIVSAEEVDISLSFASPSTVLPSAFTSPESNSMLTPLVSRSHLEDSSTLGGQTMDLSSWSYMQLASETSILSPKEECDHVLTQLKSEMNEFEVSNARLL